MGAIRASAGGTTGTMRTHGAASAGLAWLIALALAGCAAVAVASPSVPAPGPATPAAGPSGTGPAATGPSPSSAAPTAVPTGPAGPTPVGSPAPDPTPAPLPLRGPFPPAFAIETTRAVLVVWEGGDITGSHRLLTVYEDGSILAPWAEAFGGPGVRRLSGAGLRHLLDRLGATGAFDRARAFPPAPDWQAGFASFDFDLLTGATPTRVTATSASRHPMARALMALGEALRDPAAFLPAAEEWAAGDPSLHPFLPTHVLVTVQSVGIGDDLVDLPDERLPVLADLLPGPVDSLGVVVTDPASSSTARCVVVDGEAGYALQEAAARRFDVLDTGILIDAIPAAEFPALGGVDLASEDGRALVRVAWQPAVPGREPACDGAALPQQPNPARYAAGGADMVLAAARGIGTGGELRLEVRVRSDAAGWDQQTVMYLDDGTVVVARPPAPLAGYAIRRLTDAGVGQLDGRLAGAGLPDGERHPPSTDGAVHLYTLVLAPDLIIEAADTEQGPLARRIIELVEDLVRPETAFPAAAWRDPALLPYRPDQVAVRVEWSEVSVAPRARLSVITPPFDPATFGAPGIAAPEIRCAVLPIDDARALALSLRAVTAPLGERFSFAGDTPRRRLDISFELRGPMDTPPSCD